MFVSWFSMRMSSHPSLSFFFYLFQLLRTVLCKKYYNEVFHEYSSFQKEFLPLPSGKTKIISTSRLRKINSKCFGTFPEKVAFQAFSKISDKSERF